MQKLRILFKGWFEIPHSYSMVNCFQIVHLYKNYGSNITFYIEEMPYFRQDWNNARKLVYNEEYNNIIKSFKKWNGEEVDIIYSITYPYDITINEISNKPVPKCVFYTSEFSTLDTNYFTCKDGNNNSIHLSDSSIKEHVAKNKNLYMTSPSVWSSLGMDKYELPRERNRIITHGVDTNVFYKITKNNSNKNIRSSIRKFYKVEDTDILLLNIGAMTKNKGMLLILYLLHILVNKLGKTNYKLLLKGTGDLYQSKVFLEIYFEELQNGNIMNKEEMNLLLANNIIFTDKTLSYQKINELFNAADLYLSPYLAEGFNLTSLEALASGLPVIIPRTGSTREYIRDIYENGGENFVFYLDSSVIDLGNGMRQNSITMENFVHTVVENEHKIRLLQKWRTETEGNETEGELNETETNSELNETELTETDLQNSYNKMRDYISKEYSWNKVSDLLYNYFLYIKSRVN
jgi:glycosyltransferase involved in cell wall biosynthesis